MASCEELLRQGAAAAQLSSAFLDQTAEPLTIAERLKRNPFLMAPMAGVSDASYRLMALAGGASLAYTEMVSVAGIHYKSEKTWELVEPQSAEPSIAVQLFGSIPEQFAEAAEGVCERLGNRLALIDINMACPVPKVVRKGEGSALLDEPERAAAIVEAVRSHATCEVTCKIRVARRAGEFVGADFARRMEAAGVSAIAVHGRSATQMYRGNSNDELVARVAQAVSVPVIGSGDVLDAERAAHVVRDLGCAGAFVARGTYGNPWIFTDAQRLLASASPDAANKSHLLHPLSARLAALALQVQLMEATGAHMARARSIAGWYLRGIPEASHWRAEAVACSTAQEFLALIDKVRAQASDA